MDHSKNSLINLTIICIISSAAIYLFLLSPSSALFLPRRCSSHYRSASLEDVPKDDLEAALSRASMPNKTVIIAIVNRAYAEEGMDSDKSMLALFLESFWLGEGTRGLLDHVLLVAVDETAYQRCMFQRLHCYRLVTDGVDFRGEKLYMSKDFIRMMWRRTEFLSDVLKRGYSFVFTDMDVMWLRNPFERLSSNHSVDFQISTDEFNGNTRSEKNWINTGFYFVRSNNKTISLFNTWYSRKDNATGMKEQDVLLELVRGGIFRELELNVRFLDTRHFSGFCEDSKDFNSVCTVHANCCRSITAKIFDLGIVLRDWKRFQRFEGRIPSASNETRPYRWSPHVGCWRSWKVGNTTGNQT